MKILFWSSDKWIGRLIQFFTGSRWTHVAIEIEGFVWESAIEGAQVSEKSGYQISKVPVRPLTDRELHDIWYYCARAVRHGWPYNFCKIVALAVVYPTRWVWRRLGWVPFDRDVYGETCSGFVDEAFKVAGIDLLPLEHEGYTSPGDIWDSKFLEDG